MSIQPKNNATIFNLIKNILLAIRVNFVAKREKPFRNNYLKNPAALWRLMLVAGANVIRVVTYWSAGPVVSVNKKTVSSLANTLWGMPLWRASICPLRKSTRCSSIVNSISPSST